VCESTDVVGRDKLVERWMNVRNRKREVGGEGTYNRWRAVVISLAR